MHGTVLNRPGQVRHEAMTSILPLFPPAAWATFQAVFSTEIKYTGRQAFNPLEFESKHQSRRRTQWQEKE